MRIGVVTFPGSLDDRDAQRAVREAGGEAVALWHGDSSIKNVDAVVLPGGFSYVTIYGVVQFLDLHL